MKFWRQRKDEELNAEIRHHLDEAIRDRIARGETPEQARLNAQREFGNVGLVKEVTREMWGWTQLERSLQDLRFGVRLLFKHKSFTLIAVLSLALGIGATTAIFSLLDALLWKTLPVNQPEQLVSVNGLGFAYPDAVYRELREKNSVFAGMFTFHALEVTMSDGQQAEPVLGELVSGDFYTVLGVAPHLGRVFNKADDQTPGAHFVTVLSYDFWQRRFGADPQIIGKQIKINNHSFTIVGVSARDFRHVEIGSAPAVRVPMMMKREMLDYIDTTPVMARLKEGVSLAQAQAATETLYQNILAPFGANVPPANRRPIRLVAAETGVARGAANLRNQYSQSLLLLLALVGAVLLIACLNVANLLLARAATRQKEIAVRLAVGAGRFRLVRQLLTEGFVLAALGGALGLLFARWGTVVLLGFLPPKATLEIEPDGRMLAFTSGVTVLTGLLFGLAPAMQATRFDLIPALKNDAVGTATIVRRWELRRLLVVLQVALSLVLLVGGGLFARSLRNLRAVNHGYSSDQIVTMEIAPDRSGYTAEQQQNFYAQLHERVAALPGVQAATYLGMLPLNGSEGFEGKIEIPGSRSSPNQKATALFYGISPQFFATFGLSLQRGRDFTMQDVKTPLKSILVNDSFARAFFGAENPLGKRVSTGSFKDMEIVGVASDAKVLNLKETMSRTVYYIQEPRHMGRQRLCVRAIGDVAALITAIRHEVRSLDPNLPLYNVKTFDRHINESISRERLIALLASFFSLFALLLAALGLYGVMAYAVARRSREISIRMALGAQAGSVLWLVLRETLWLVLIGIGIGLPAALAATKLTKGLLFGLTANDPLTMTMATMLLIGIALLAGFLPARRAARVDPLIALRHE
ncbi:MAG: ABC transporter permease [Acidobacteriota bacterium]|nr:ABC transporter permease [Acidobacteriota bacterium]